MTHTDLFEYVKANAKQLFGSQFWEARLVCKADIGPKPDRLESRILVLSKFRLFFLSGKVASKLHIEASHHLLAINEISASGVQSEISIVVDGRRLLIRLVDQDVNSHDLAIHLLTAFKHYFPNCDVHRFIELAPTSLYATYAQLPSARPTLPCNGFRRTYASLCDYYKQLFRDEIVWDIEKIYSLHNSTVLRLDDFSHLSPKDLIPLISTLQFSSWFNGISSESLKLSIEVIDTLISVLRKSQRLKELLLKNAGLKPEFLISMAQALNHNPTIPLENLDLSGNVFDENKCVAQLSSSLASLSSRLRAVCFENCCLTVKAANSLCSALQRNQERNETPVLSVLNLSQNLFKDDVTELYHLVCHSPTLTYLNLSGAGIPLEKIWTSLKPCASSIVTLKLCGCTFVSRKFSKDSTIPNLVKDFFSNCTSLKTVDLSDTVIPAEILKFMLLGFVINQSLDEVSLDLSRSYNEKACITVLEPIVPTLNCVSELTLRDCALEQDVLVLLPSISRMSKLRRLDIGGNNFVSTRKQPAKQIKSILIEMVKLISDEDSPVRELCLSDCRIGVSLCVLLNALGVAPRLKLLDISGNDIGNFGARLLAKALQVNSALETVLLDRNQITFEGYSDIVHALKENNSLMAIPYPLHDAAESLKLNREKTENALTDIDRFLRRNNSNQGFVSCVEASSWLYETHSKLLLGNVEDELNKVASKTAQLLEEWKHSEDTNPDVALAAKLLQDAENAKLMLDQLLNETDEGEFIVTQMRNVGVSLAEQINISLKESAQMLADVPLKENYSVCQNNDFIASLRSACMQKAQMDVAISVQEFSKALRQRYSAVQFSIAATVSEKVCQELLKSLTNVNKILSSSKKASISSLNAEKLSTSGTPTGKKKFKFFNNKNRPLSIVEGHGVPNFADLADDQETHERLDGSIDNCDNNSMEISDDTKTSESSTTGKDGTQPLTHVQKGRARPPRNHKIKAPPPPATFEHEGVDHFFTNNKSPGKVSDIYDHYDDHHNKNRQNLKIDISTESGLIEKRVSRMPGVPILMPGVLQQLGSRISPRNETVTIADSLPANSTGAAPPAVLVSETSNFPKTAKLPPKPPPPVFGVKHSTVDPQPGLKSPTHWVAPSAIHEHSVASSSSESSTTAAPATATAVSSKEAESSSSAAATESGCPTVGNDFTSSCELSFSTTSHSTPISSSTSSGRGSGSENSTVKSSTAEHSSSVSMETSSCSPFANDAVFVGADQLDQLETTDVVSEDLKKSAEAPTVSTSLITPALSAVLRGDSKQRPLSEAPPQHAIRQHRKDGESTTDDDQVSKKPDFHHSSNTHPVVAAQDHNGNNPHVAPLPQQHDVPRPAPHYRPERPPLPTKPPPARPLMFQRVWDQPNAEETNVPSVAMRQKLTQDASSTGTETSSTASSANNADNRKSVLEMKRVFEASKLAGSQGHGALSSSMTSSVTGGIGDGKPVPPPRVRTNKVAPSD